MKKGTEIPDFVRKIIYRLEGAGYRAYVVGGAVRDMRLQRPVGDWDVATAAPPEKIRSVFRHFRQFSPGHDTVALVDGDRHYEIATFKGMGTHGHSIEEDLGCRDFTINAMAYDVAAGVILDPYEGWADGLRKQIKAVGRPEDRFLEDPLRMLRAVRLVAELGFKIEQNTLEAISRLAHHLGTTARERVRDELKRILMTRKPSRGLQLLVRTGLIKEMLPELLEGYGKRQNAYHLYTIYRHITETVDHVEAIPVLRLAALFHDIAKPRVRAKIKGEWHFHGHEEASAEMAREIMKRLRFGNEILGQVANLIEHHMISYRSEWSDGAVRRLLVRVGPENVDNLLSIRRADLIAHGRKDHKMDLLSDLEKRVKELRMGPLLTQTADLAIDGRRVMELTGLSPGPAVGRVLKALMEKVTDRPELNTEEGLAALIKEVRG